MLDRYAAPDSMIDLARSTEPIPGNRYRGSAPSLGRYFFDSELGSRDGWAQVDTNQDASYYGTWTNARNRTTVSYCEGDVTIERYTTNAEYIQSIRELAAWEPFKAIDAYRIEDDFRRLGLDDLLH